MLLQEQLDVERENNAVRKERTVRACRKPQHQPQDTAIGQYRTYEPCPASTAALSMPLAVALGIARRNI